uniref:Uncharacterized protein n=1 Tax=Oryza brachyantha TaxID=4533 RepID=J3LWD8_ORYBR
MACVTTTETSTSMGTKTPTEAALPQKPADGHFQGLFRNSLPTITSITRIPMKGAMGDFNDMDRIGGVEAPLAPMLPPLGGFRGMTYETVDGSGTMDLYSITRG